MPTITPETRRFGALLQSYRKKAGLTQEELCLATQRIAPPGVKRDYLASMETGKIRIVYPEDFNSLHRTLLFPAFELLEAMGYDTDLDHRDLDPSLVTAARQLDRERQRALAGVARTLAKG